MKKYSPKTDRQTETHNEYKKRDIDSATVDGAYNNIIDNVLKISIIITSKEIDSYSRLEPPNTGSADATAVHKNSLGDCSPLNKVKKNQVSPSWKINISNILGTLTGDLAVQFTPKNIHPVSKQPRNRKRASVSKQQSLQPKRTRKPGKTITVRDDSLIIMNIKDSPDLPSVCRVNMTGCTGKS